MKTLNMILLHLDHFGIDHGWFHPFLFFFFFMCMLMLLFFIFRGRRRGYYSSCWPGWFSSRHYEKPEAKDILKKRYAKGEINKEEYDKMLKDIS